MRNGSWIVGQLWSKPLAAAALAAALIGGAGTGFAKSEAASVDVTVTITDLRSAEGVVRACMTTDPGRFPKCRGAAGAHSAVVPAGDGATVTFNGVKPGRYAIALLHDENDNGKADRALMMMPKEGFGFSRDAKVRMGPPKFDAAAFDVGTAPIRQTIRMRYML
ncbi:MAG: DUF2141 domain-containing protein [Alteripontixanthobacter sp.]